LLEAQLIYGDDWSRIASELGLETWFCRYLKNRFTTLLAKVEVTEITSSVSLHSQDSTQVV